MQFSFIVQNRFKKTKLSFENLTIFRYNSQTIKNTEKDKSCFFS